MFCQPCGPEIYGKPAVENFFHQRIAARHHIADHEQIRLQRDLFRVETFDQLDALRFELRAHRRINIGVAAGDIVACFRAQSGDAAHEGAADAENMNMLH